MTRTSLGLLATLALSAACISPTTGGSSGDASVDTTTTTDAAPDVPRLEAAVDVPVIDSGCPAPATVATAAVPTTGFLPAINARFVRAVDGDTAHFVIPIQGEIIVRMLWVNTEESHGTETTVFGVQTGDWAMMAMPMNGPWQLVRQEDPRRPGQPALDPYDRTLALVFSNGTLWQTRLIREGWTAYYTDFGCAPEPIHSSLLFAEAEARANHRGIWAPGHPTDYAEVFSRWITTRCRPNPFRNQPYCTAQ